MVSLPGTDTTAGLIGAETLNAIRPGATVVNVGRGSVIDHAALIPALRDGRVGYAALDVTAVEPLPADDPLWEMGNVLISPHTAALTADEGARIVDLFVGNARRLLDVQSLLNTVNSVNTVEFY